MALPMRLVTFLLILLTETLANQGSPQGSRPFSSSQGPASQNSIGKGLANTLGDLIRFEFSGSVETHLIGPRHDDDNDDTIDGPPLVELDTSSQPHLVSKSVPSLYIGLDYDFGQRQRKWHGISYLLSRLRFRPAPGVALDVSREQAMDYGAPSATTLQCSWKGYSSSLRNTVQSSSLLFSLPVLPSRLRWDCSLSSQGELPEIRPPRSGWLVDAMGQIQGSRSFQLSQDTDARCSLRRRIQWINSDEGMAESTHVGLSLRCRHCKQYSTMASFSAQLEQLQDSARFRIRHDVAVGSMLNR